MNNKELVEKLDILLQRAICPDNQDITALDGFCATIKSGDQAVNIATKLLANKIQSKNSTEAINALNVLEECMAQCGEKFQSEVGKFRFLNELIKLVSKRHHGNTTPKITQDKILDLLLLWNVQYPHETKIKEAYDMLRTQGVVHEPAQKIIRNTSSTSSAVNVATSSMKSSDDETSKRLKKLLQSKNPLDLKAANLIIQSIVREEEKRTLMKSLRLLEVKRVRENVSVLNEMLDHYKPSDTSEDALNTINQLHNTCESLHPTVLRLAEECKENDDSLADIIEASDQLSEIFEKYKKIIINKSCDSDASITSISSSNNTNTDNGKSDALLDLLNSSPDLTLPLSISNNNNALGNESSNFNVLSVNDTMNDLTEIFSTTMEPPIEISNNILLPSIVNNSTLNNLDDSTKKQSPIVTSKVSIFDGKSPIKSNPQLSKTIPDLDDIVSGMLQTGLCNNKTENLSNLDVSENDDEKMITCDDEVISVNVNKNEEMKVDIKNIPLVEDVKQIVPIKMSLADIKIDLDKINPSKEPSRIVLNEPNGLKVILNFAEDHPRPDVTIIVISVINQGREPISAFNFDASISKSCKLHFLPPSAVSLPGVKPFRAPSEDITQVILFSNSKKIKDVNMICIVSYCVGDDPDPIRESIEIKNLPYLIED